MCNAEVEAPNPCIIEVKVMVVYKQVRVDHLELCIFIVQLYITVVDGRVAVSYCNTRKSCIEQLSIPAYEHISHQPR